MSDQPSLLSLLCRLWAHILPRRRMQLAALGGLMLMGTLTEIASLGMVIPFLGALTAPNYIFEHPLAQPMITIMALTAPQQLALPLTVLFGGAAIFAGATRLGLLWGQTRLGNAIGVDLGSAAFRRTLYQPYVVHTSRNSSEVVAILMTKINTIIYFIIIPLLSLITSTFIVLTVFVFMTLVEPELTVMTLFGFGSLYALVTYVTKKRLARDSQQVTAGQSHAAKVVQEGLGAIRDVLIDGLQETYFRIYRQVDSRFRLALGNIAIISGIPRPVIEAFGVALIGWMAYAMSNRPEGMATAIPMIGALALAAQRLLPLVQQGYSGWISMRGGQASLRDVLEMLEQPLPAHSSLPPPTPMPFRQAISISGLHFRYNSQSPWILQDLNLKIPRGSRVGLIGTTGSGKSTFLDIVMGLLSPTSGAIQIDGVSLDETNRRAWQAHIAHVPQSIFLADSTIEENIAFGVPRDRIDSLRVRHAAQQAQIADSIESWPTQYQTIVGERGIRLSGGQRQRIGIARALYRRADVIIFDEATSALDNETEQAVMNAIEGLSKDLTLLIIAHRLTTLKNCSQVVELGDGGIKRAGSFQEIGNQYLHASQGNQSSQSHVS